jgi:hypothetical protein
MEQQDSSFFENNTVVESCTEESHTGAEEGSRFCREKSSREKSSSFD